MEHLSFLFLFQKAHTIEKDNYNNNKLKYTEVFFVYKKQEESMQLGKN